MCDENTNQGTGNATLNWQRIAGILAAVIFIQAGLGIGIYYWGSSWTERGQFGDMFGAVNTLFSGLAFAGVIYAIILQSNELKLQRKEFRLSRDVNRAAAKAQAEQADLLDRASKMKALESEFQLHSVVMQAFVAVIAAKKTRGESEKHLADLWKDVTIQEGKMENVLGAMKELAGLETEPPETPTPQS